MDSVQDDDCESAVRSGSAARPVAATRMGMAQCVGMFCRVQSLPVGMRLTKS
jgi:hypothetical protein